MGQSPYLQRLREAVGKDLILVPGAAGIVRDEHDRILLLQRADDGTWDLPGGATDPGETPVQTVEREVREESGLTVRAVRLAGVFGGRDFRRTYPDGGTVEGLVTVFDCERIGGELHPQPGEVTTLRFFDVRDMPDLSLPYPPRLFSARDSSTLFQRDD